MKHLGYLSASKTIASTPEQVGHAGDKAVRIERLKTPDWLMDLSTHSAVGRVGDNLDEEFTDYSLIVTWLLRRQVGHNPYKLDCRPSGLRNFCGGLTLCNRRRSNTSFWDLKFNFILGYSRHLLLLLIPSWGAPCGGCLSRTDTGWLCMNISI